MAWPQRRHVSFDAQVCRQMAADVVEMTPNVTRCSPNASPCGVRMSPCDARITTEKRTLQNVHADMLQDYVQIPLLSTKRIMYATSQRCATAEKTVSLGLDMYSEQDKHIKSTSSGCGSRFLGSSAKGRSAMSIGATTWWYRYWK